MRYLVFDLNKKGPGLSGCVGGYDTLAEATKECHNDWFEVYDMLEDSLYEPCSITGPVEWLKIRNFIRDGYQKR